MKRRAFLSLLALAAAPALAFDLGSPVSGRVLTAADMRQALNLKP